MTALNGLNATLLFQIPTFPQFMSQKGAGDLKSEDGVALDMNKAFDSVTCDLTYGQRGSWQRGLNMLVCIFAAQFSTSCAEIEKKMNHQRG